MELTDAAPLLAAKELGYFDDEGLRVSLHRQVGWGNVRDKLVHGQLHASHALLGMPPMSILRPDVYPARLSALMGLGFGGNAITLGRKLTDNGIDSPAALARQRQKRKSSQSPLLAHVFGCSMHHYLLRDWLHEGGADPDKDVRLCVLPPSQMPRQLGLGGIDGFCAGEPWNTVAEDAGLGRIITATTALLPDHPEKVLAARQQWIEKYPGIAEALVRATLRGCMFCCDPANLQKLAQILAGATGHAVTSQSLMCSLMIDRQNTGGTRRATAQFRSCAPATTFPAATHVAWLLHQMIRWGHLPAETHVLDAARQAVNSAPYRRAAAALNLQTPHDDLPPMRLRSGWFDPKLPASGQLADSRYTTNSAFRSSADSAPARSGV